MVNSFETKYCSECSYPLVPDAFDEIKDAEKSKFDKIEEQHKQDIRELDKKWFKDFVSLIQQIPYPGTLFNFRVCRSHSSL